MFVHIEKALRLYLDYHVITCTYVLYLLFTIKPKQIVFLNTTTTILTFSSERNRPIIRKERATHISSERIRFAYMNKNEDGDSYIAVNILMNQGSNGPVNAHLRSGTFTNKTCLTTYYGNMHVYYTCIAPG